MGNARYSTSVNVDERQMAAGDTVVFNAVATGKIVAVSPGVGATMEVSYRPSPNAALVAWKTGSVVAPASAYEAVPGPMYQIVVTCTGGAGVASLGSDY